MTGIKSRFVCLAGGIILIVLGLMPKMGLWWNRFRPWFWAVLVWGGSAWSLLLACAFSLVSISQERCHDLCILAVAVGFGEIPLIAPDFKMWRPHAIHPLIKSGIMLAFIVAVVLNAFFNGAKGSIEEAKAAASAADH